MKPTNKKIIEYRIVTLAEELTIIACLIAAIAEMSVLWLVPSLLWFAMYIYFTPNYYRNMYAVGDSNVLSR